MLKRLRWRLTAFNTAVTGAILLGVTVLSLFVSERDTRAVAFGNFADDLSTVSAYVGSQNQLSATWLRQMEETGHLYISIRDGGMPLYSMGLLPERKSLEPEFHQVWERAKWEYHLNADFPRSSGSCVFPMRGDNGGSYFGGLALIPKGGRTLEVMLLYPLAQIEAGIHRQRLVVFLGEVLALGLLWVFSWHFTGKLLQPIVENQQRQAQFTAAASHELRTPLAAILSAVSAMGRAEPDQRQQFSDMVFREGHRMGRLIEDMLTLASADAKSWELRPERVELDMLLLGLYEQYQPLAREKGLTLGLELPEGDCPAGMLDKDRIVQALTVLLDNALSYTPAPGSVTLGLSWKQKTARITVADTGPGILDGEKAHIFERFHRGEKARSDRKHYGLGLSIAAEMVKLHRGRLWVEDAQGGGAVFLMELPLENA